MRLLIAVLIAGCLPLGAGAQLVEHEGPSDVIFIESGNAEMEAAIEEARATLPHFWEHYSATEDLSVEVHTLKVGFSTPEGDSEFIWVFPYDYDETAAEYEGILMNEPLNIAGDLHLGDAVWFAEDQIIDWSYDDGPARRGEYTTRVLIRGLSPEDAADFAGALHDNPVP